MVRRSSALLCGAVWLLGGCGPGSDVEVRVCGDLNVPAEMDALRVSFRNEIFGELRGAVVGLVDEAGVRSLPLSVSLPADRDARWVIAEALLEGIVVGRFDRRVTTLEDGSSVGLVLTQVCYRMTCPTGQTCVDSACVTAPGPIDAPNCGGS